MALDLSNLSADVLAFMAERHLATLSLTGLSSGDRPSIAQPPLHVTPVGFTYEPGANLARVITFAQSKKVRLIEAHQAAGHEVAAALSQVDGGRWLTLYGTATVSADPAVNADAMQRYADRYRPPGDRGTDRRTIIVDVTRLVGRA